ncbi:hypothetical protein PR048_001086 [Dryococelus australis]|uniref:Uncharacterized protein n=1 Tax=Dryococelus australis TaxID=614101 RepID=A0ABQ9IIU3_9NEOP|nr:hypothetical protein PR048_001086 [Dryococelus australis]
MLEEVSKQLEEFEQQVCQQVRELQDRLTSVAQESNLIPYVKNCKPSLTVFCTRMNELTSSKSTRQICLLFHGIAEKPDENVTDAVLEIMKEMLDINIEQSAINNVHRIGKTNRSAAQAVKEGKRPIIVKFVSYQFRSMVFHAKRALKNTPFVITESLTVDRSAKEKFGTCSCF